MRHWEYMTVTLRKGALGLGRWIADEVEGNIPEDWQYKKYDSISSFCNLMDEIGWELVTATQVRGDYITLFFRHPIR